MKHKLFWILYFVIAILMIAVAALLMPQYVILTWYSLFPVFYIVLSLLTAKWNSPSNREKRIAFEQGRLRLFSIQYDKQLGLVTEDHHDEKIRRFLERDERKCVDDFVHKAFFVITPLFLPFVLFFGAVIKILSCSMWIPVAIGALICSFRVTNERIRKREKEREEQERREERGEWK
ncbi:MAG: hypothetical protein IKC75_03560 [Clostridia bacterium]|nr:hypothetical protein [Clostridia bacterium]